MCFGFRDPENPLSPKSHTQSVGDPVERSVNVTCWPGAGLAGANVKFATGPSPAATTVTDWLLAFDPEEFTDVSVTVKTPVEANVCVVYCPVELPPSPKIHDHEVGEPVEVSENWTACPTEGDGGKKVKFATGATLPERTVTGWLLAFVPEEFAEVSETVKTPAEANVCEGFCALELPPSPKVHDHEVGEPVEVSENWTACPTKGDAGTNEKLATGGLEAPPTTLTASRAFTLPAPHVLPDPAPVKESFVAVPWRACKAASQVSAGFAWSMRATIPVMCGAAWLVPDRTRRFPPCMILVAG